MNMVRIDCGTCAVRGPACGDCMVTALLGGDEVLGREVSGAPTPGVMTLQGDEVSALRAMTEAGLLPPLRLVRSVSRRPPVELNDDRWFESDHDVV
jgi:hypothetical protein